MSKTPGFKRSPSIKLQEGINPLGSPITITKINL